MCVKEGVCVGGGGGGSGRIEGFMNGTLDQGEDKE